MTVADFQNLYSETLSHLYTKDEAKNILLVAAEHVCDQSRRELLLNRHRQIAGKEQVSLELILAELLEGKPIQYVLGETEFSGLRLKVNPSVLVPRPETEELVDWIITDVRSATPRMNSLSILDIGTGSGCIPLALKKNFPAAALFGLDISSSALETARRNSMLNQLDVNFIEADILSPHANLQAKSFDVIVSNPPYITATEKEKMHQNVLDYEPHLALFVEDADPLLFYNSITSFAAKHLKENGCSYFEINELFGKEMVQLLTSNGYSEVELRKDLMGKDRMIKGVLS